MANTSDKLQRLKETNTIDGFTAGGAKEVGRIVDLHNDFVTRKKDKRFEKDMNDRNLYFWKLWLKALEEARQRKGVEPENHKRKVIVE